MDKGFRFSSIPLPQDFTRRLTDSFQIESTCNRCGWVLVGDVSTGHPYDELAHQYSCTGKPLRPMLVTGGPNGAGSYE